MQETTERLMTRAPASTAACTDSAMVANDPELSESGVER
ncbi:hypothetical protein CZ765_02665 [Corynebacterium casei]|nr:hypothetical protein CZ765_02665 [Corynebacterium casei]